jgi:hypothetical protein
MHSLGASPLFDWDEINFAESAREMLVSGDYLRVQINFQPFWEKPPLFFWMQVLTMKLFGINEYAARFPNAVCGVVTLLVIYSIGKRLHDVKFAAWWVLLYLSSFLPHVYFKSGIIDPWFNLFIFLGIYFLSAFLENNALSKNKVSLILSGLFTGLAVLTKGPVGLLVVALTYIVFILLNKGKDWVAIKYYLIWVLTVLLVAMIWFGLEIGQHGWWFINEFFTYQVRLAKTEDAGHGGFPLYHFVVILLGCFPASILFLQFKKNKQIISENVIFKKMMLASLLVILIVFSLVKTKIIHYSSFAYFPVVYLAASVCYNLINGKAVMSIFQNTIGVFVSAIWVILFVSFPIIAVNIHWLKPLLKADPFGVANLNAVVEWNYSYVIPGLLFFGGIIFSVVSFYKREYAKGLISVCIASIIMVQIFLTVFTPKIELYTQHAAIEFFQRLKGKDVYVKVLGYKSYAPFFYAQVLPPKRKDTADENWLIYGEVDKPVYFVTRLDRKKEVLLKYGNNLKILYEKNGFVFMERKNY